MTQVIQQLNLLDLNNNYGDTIKYIVRDGFQFPDNIDINEWNDEIVNKDLITDIDGCYDLLFELIDDYVSNCDINNLENLVYRYGISKSIDLYDNTFGIDDCLIDKNDTKMFIRKLAFVVIREHIEINDDDI